MNYKTLLIAATAATLLLTGCETDRSTTLQDSLKGNTVEDKIAGFAVFNPAEGEIPYPNNILLAPNSSSTDDYDYGRTLNIPYEPTDADAGIKKQLNELTGFSTTSPITAPITAALDDATMPAGVQLYEVSIDPATGAVVSVDATLTFGVDYVATQSGSNLAIIPLQPLKSLTNYMVVLTSDLKDASGRVLAPDIATALTLSPNPVEPSDSLNADTAAALEKLRQANQAMLTALINARKDPSNTVQIWNFRTQLIGAIQANIAAYAPGTAQLELKDTGIDTVAALQLASTGNARIYDGNLSGLIQYMPQSTTNDPTNALTGQFKLDTTFKPEVNATITVPVVAFIPNSNSGCTMPTAGWPVVIYQHGITRQRTDLFVYGETLATSPICHAAVAMDLPLHGVTDTTNPFYKAGMERTFDFDLVTEDSDDNVIAEVPDGVIDSSGTYYMNLKHVMTTRDNMHQTTSDLLELETALATTLFANEPTLLLDPAHVNFLAHSLGTISSIGYVNKSTQLQTATLAMPGQGVIDIIRYSPVFSPAINAGLAAAGINEGSPEYASFMLASQTIVEDADPANYTAAIGTGPLPILEFEAVGDGSDGSGDQHILNTIPQAPLAGTEPFIKFTKAVDVNTSGLNPGDLYVPSGTKTVTRLTEGEHRSPLDPQYSQVATTEIHTEMASFIYSAGTAITVADPSIIKQ